MGGGWGTTRTTELGRLLQVTVATTVVLCAGGGKLNAQALAEHSDTLTITSLAELPLQQVNLVPFTERIRTTTSALNTSQYVVDYFRGRIRFTDASLLDQRVYITYRVFPGPPPGALGYTPPPDSTVKPDWR
jgi:hypothetical protein